jgi:hypothetical protein
MSGGGYSYADGYSESYYEAVDETAGSARVHYEQQTVREMGGLREKQIPRVRLGWRLALLPPQAGAYTRPLFG